MRDEAKIALTSTLAAYLRKYAIKILKKAIKMKCVRTKKQF